jgi:hypothetical protein
VAVSINVFSWFPYQVILSRLSTTAVISWLPSHGRSFPNCNVKAVLHDCPVIAVLSRLLYCIVALLSWLSVSDLSLLRLSSRGSAGFPTNITVASLSCHGCPISTVLLCCGCHYLTVRSCLSCCGSPLVTALSGLVDTTVMDVG